MRWYGVLDVAVEHRALERRPSSWAVRWMSSQRRGVGLVLADLVADFGMKDLRPAAGQAAQAGVDHLLEHLADGLLGQPAEPVDLDRRSRP